VLAAGLGSKAMPISEGVRNSAELGGITALSGRRVENSRPARLRSTQRPNYKPCGPKPFFACAPISFGEQRTGQSRMFRRAGARVSKSALWPDERLVLIARSRCAAPLVVFAGSSDGGAGDGRRGRALNMKANTSA
jgi:hypothetical protein